MRSKILTLLVFKLVMAISLISTAKIVNKYGDASIEANIKRIIAERLNTNAESISDKATFKTLGSDELADPVLILTDIQYYFDIKLDPRTFKKLSRQKTKVSDVVAATISKVYPSPERLGDASGSDGN